MKCIVHGHADATPCPRCLERRADMHKLLSGVGRLELIEMLFVADSAKELMTGQIRQLRTENRLMRKTGPSSVTPDAEIEADIVTSVEAMSARQTTEARCTSLEAQLAELKTGGGYELAKLRDEERAAEASKRMAAEHSLGLEMAKAEHYKNILRRLLKAEAGGPREDALRQATKAVME